MMMRPTRFEQTPGTRDAREAASTAHVFGAPDALAWNQRGIGGCTEG
jgi:hypothetical protein